MLLGKSPAMRTIHTTIHQLSNDSKIPVLITGETGGLVAQAIHFGGAPGVKTLCAGQLWCDSPYTLGIHFLWPCPWRIHRSDGRS